MQTSYKPDSASSKLDKQIEDRIYSKDYDMRAALKRAEGEFSQFLKASIIHHKYMAKLAEENGYGTVALRHRLLVEVYRQLVNSFSLSNSYAAV